MFVGSEKTLISFGTNFLSNSLTFFDIFKGRVNLQSSIGSSKIREFTSLGMEAFSF